MIYNVNNEIVCDYDCSNCIVSASCTDRVIEKDKEKNEQTDC